MEPRYQPRPIPIPVKTEIPRIFDVRIVDCLMPIQRMLTLALYYNGIHQRLSAYQVC